MAKQITRELLERGVAAIDGLCQMLEAAGVRPAVTEMYREVGQEIRECYEDKPPEPVQGQTSIYDLLTDSSPSQPATLQRDA
jgi:hypothetical protein